MPLSHRTVFLKVEIMLINHSRYTSTGICTHPEQQIYSCQNIGSQFLISNQKFNVTFKHCEGMEWTKDKVQNETELKQS